MVTWADGADCTPPAPADARSSLARATGLSRPTARILRTSADIWSRQFLAERADLPKNRGVSIFAHPAVFMLGCLPARSAVPASADALRALIPRIDDGNDRSPALRALMHGIDRYEHRRIADGRCRHAADRGFCMAVMMHIGVVEHDLPASAQGAVAIGLAFDEAVHQSALEILGARTRRKIDAGIADGIVNAVDIERIAHDAMAYAITAASPGGVAEQHDLRLGELDTRGARRDGGVEIEISADLLGARQLDLAERERDAERGRAVGDAHGVVNLAGDFVAARVRLADGFDGEQRRLGLHVMHVTRSIDPGVPHRRFDRLRDFFHHRRPADIL